MTETIPTHPQARALRNLLDGKRTGDGLFGASAHAAHVQTRVSIRRARWANLDEIHPQNDQLTDAGRAALARYDAHEEAKRAAGPRKGRPRKGPTHGQGAALRAVAAGDPYGDLTASRAGLEAAVPSGIWGARTSALKRCAADGWVTAAPLYALRRCIITPVGREALAKYEAAQSRRRS